METENEKTVISTILKKFLSNNQHLKSWLDSNMNENVHPNHLIPLSFMINDNLSNEGQNPGLNFEEINKNCWETGIFRSFTFGDNNI